MCYNEVRWGPFIGDLEVVRTANGYAPVMVVNLFPFGIAPGIQPKFVK